MNNIVFASVISEIQQSPMFMTVKAVICDTPEANLNGAKVTEKFVNEVVKNEKRYVGLPLYADVKALTNGSYNRLGHLYDVKTGEFHSTQIGSFYKFEKEAFDAGYHLIGYARIPKRNKKLSNAIAELFAQGRLKFSFEVSVGEYVENDDGTITIDASENNYLEGTAIVTYPACEDAVALELVAQQKTVTEESVVAEESVADETRKGDEEMAEVETTAEVVEAAADTSVDTPVETEAAQPELAEEEKVEAVTEEVSQETEEKTDETTACKDKKEKAENETAEVYLVETSVEKHETHAFDTETGKAIHQEIKIETTTENSLEGTLVEADDGAHIAETKETAESSDNSGEVVEIAEGEDGGAEGGNSPGAETPAPVIVEEEDDTDTSGGVKAGETEEEGVDSIPDSSESRKTAELIDALTAAVEELRKEVAELKETKVVAAKTMTAEVNPMIDDIKTQKKYAALEKVTSNVDYRSALEKY